MKTRKSLAVILGAAILASVVALPKLVHADGISIHIGDGDHHRDHEEHHWLRHEEMDAAIASLRDARMHLDKGGHDFGGHRVKAIRMADKAIQEIQASIDYANTHER
jgi:hypothetical protein